jgi:integrase/recombinase XerD
MGGEEQVQAIFRGWAWRYPCGAGRKTRICQRAKLLPNSVRDRAMLELFYSTGLRRTELCRLELADLNTERRTLHVCQGKGKKDRMVSAWLRQAGLKKKGCCHVLRHTCATHMLENGADIRFIQQLLGHEKLDTTAIYTEVSIKQLQEVHARCHPSAQAVPAPNAPDGAKK